MACRAERIIAQAYHWLKTRNNIFYFFPSHYLGVKDSLHPIDTGNLFGSLFGPHGEHLRV